MNPLPSALILDFGGVLTTDLWHSVRAFTRREGLPEATLLDLMGHDPQIHPLYLGLERGDISQTEFEARLAAAAGIAPERLLARMCADLRPDEAMLAAVAALRAGGVRIGILSNSWGSGYFSPYEGYDLDHRADAVVYSDQVRLRKPEPAIFEMMLELLSVTARDSVFIDDVPANLPPAEAMGITVIHHTNTRATLAELQRIFGDLLASASTHPDA
jgi:putative hydrolase of the HAD superfamily